MSIISLQHVPKGQLVQIYAIVNNTAFGELDNMVQQRLADLGFGVGQPLEVIGRGLFGTGPYAVRLSNQSQFTLRKAEAQKVLCTTENQSF